jgi:hypothetical protein
MSSVLFVRKDGFSKLAHVEAGVLVGTETHSLSPDWTHVVAVGDYVLFVRNDGLSAVARVDGDTFSQTNGHTTLSPDWTHVVAVGENVLLVRNDGLCAVARIDAGRFVQTHSGPNLSPDWTHVLAVGDNLLFVRDDGLYAVGHIEAGRLVQTASGSDMSRNWTHVVAVGEDVLFVRNDGLFAVGHIRGGAFVESQSGGDEARDWSHVVAVSSRKAGVQVLIEPFEEPALAADRLRETAAQHPRIRELLGDLDPDRVFLTEPEVLGRTREKHAPFRAVLFDPDSNRAVELSGKLEEPEQLEVRPTSFAPVPRGDELRRAEELLRADERFAHLTERADVIIYQPMPPLADLTRPDGTVARRPTLGIYDPEGSPRHRIVAVDLAASLIDWEPAGVDVPSDSDCEDHLPARVDSFTDSGGRPQVRVRVFRDGVELWNLIVVRPRYSNPQTNDKGSGVELQAVHYLGRRLLFQAHVPILNVLYDDGTSYRDWQNAETFFMANGTDPVGPGWRLCTEPPATILESATDVGNFQGVAFWYEDGVLRIVSELQAGWYRYVSDWRLEDNGVIRPRFGFAGTRNPRTCMRHQHHAYWRFDFDIEDSANDVVEELGPFVLGRRRWFAITQETSRKRNLFSREWRVRDKHSDRGYRILSGIADGTADEYGVADLWFLHYNPNELADDVVAIGGPEAATKIRIDSFLNGESIDGADVVVWYAGHFLHDEMAPGPHLAHIVGPELRPMNWS